LRLLSSPYAFLARSAGKLTSSSGTDLVTSSGGGIVVNGPIVGSINGSNLTAGSVSSAQLAANSVTSAAIAPGAVGSSDIAAGAVGTAQIAANTITSAQIAAGAVGASEIADGSVGTAEIADGAITATKLATNIVFPGLELSGGDLKINGTNGLELGADRPVPFIKDPNAGKILYARYSGGLDIFGAGPAGFKNIKFWAEGGSVFAGRVGIGTDVPAVPLDVVGTSTVVMNDNGYNSNDGSYDNSTPPIWTTRNSTTAGGAGIELYGMNGAGNLNNGARLRAPVTIHASGWIATEMGFTAYSDRRIKRDIQPSVVAKDLEVVQKLRLTDYRMVDPTPNGKGWRKGFIAQEVEEVIPAAVTQSVEFVPDVFSLATNAVYNSAAQTLSLSLAKDHGLKVGDRVRLHLDGSRLDLNVSSVRSTYEFVVEKCDRAPQKVFVYGRQVNDFRSVDYDHIFTTGIGAIQELAKKVVAQGAELEELRAEVSKLRSERRTLAQSVSNFEARDQAREARLARLELMLEKGQVGAAVKGESRERPPSAVSPAESGTPHNQLLRRTGAGELSSLAK
jgi:hypothetical protein